MFQVSDRRHFDWRGAVEVTCREARVISKGFTAREPVNRCLEQVNYSTIDPRQLETGDTILRAPDEIGETYNSQMQLFGRNCLLTSIDQHPEEPASATLN